MSPCLYRCGMIGHDKHCKILTCTFKCLIKRSYNIFINPFNRRNFSFYITMMSTFIRSFKVNIHKVIAVLYQCIFGGFKLSLIIGIKCACCTFYINTLHTCTYSYTFYKINCGNHSTFQTCLFIEVIYPRLSTLTPKPY